MFRSAALIPVFAVGFIGNSSSAVPDEKSHRAAVEELMEATNVKKAMDVSIDQVFAAQIKANPQLETVKDVMKKFLSTHLSYAAIKDDLVKLYMEELTEAEIRETVAFYRTATGKKMVEKMPILFQKGAELGMKRVQENSAELKRMIDSELKKKQ